MFLCGLTEQARLSGALFCGVIYWASVLSLQWFGNDIGVEVLKTSNHGRGVRSCQTWAPSDNITEYTGDYLKASASTSLGTTAYFGASLGPLAGGYLMKATDNWRWTQYFNCIVIAIVFLVGLGQSETYQREIPRRRARYSGMSRKDFIRTQDPALSGESLGEMLRITVFDAIIAPFTDPVITPSTFFLLFNFAVVLQWFVSVPAALGAPLPMGPGYTIDRIGLAIGLTGTLRHVDEVDAQSSNNRHRVPPRPSHDRSVSNHHLAVLDRLDDQPDFSPIVPIIGTAVYIFGNASIIISIIPYLFDAFPPAGTSTALTSAATGRILFAGFLPKVILYDITALTPRWAFGIFGFISIAMWPIPFLLFRYGATWRANSRYSKLSVAIHDGERIHRTLLGHDSASH
ncbi:hypothetical protein LTR17_026652 [Elasticomyces elasticus]|nr:hypothetical protein LTR17_026652 [Elasticomyces elasticus]